MLVVSWHKVNVFILLVLRDIAKCDVRILLVLQWVAEYDVRISFILEGSGNKNYGNRKSAEWKCVYFHWFCVAHVRILLVLNGSVTNNALYCAAADWNCAYFHWFWEGWIPADLRKQWFWDRCKAKVLILLWKSIIFFAKASGQAGRQGAGRGKGMVLFYRFDS